MEGKNATQTLKLQAMYSAFSSLISSLPTRVRSNHMIFELFNTVVVRFLILIVNFSATTLITRALSVADRGKYAILLNLINILVTFFTFGFHSSIVYRLSNNLKLFLPLYTISFAISVASGFLILFFFLCGDSFYSFSDLNFLDYFLLICGSPIVLFSYFSSFFFLGVNKFKKYNFFEFIKSFSFLLFVLLIINSKNDYQFYIFLFIVSSVVHVVGSFFSFQSSDYIQLKSADIKNNFKNCYAVFKKSFSYSMMSYLSCNLALFLSRYNLFFISSLEDSGNNMLGYYSVALNNVDIISILPATLAFFIFPKISAAVDMKIKIRIATQMIIVCILFFLFIGILSFTILDYVFDILYGSLYQESVPMFQLLLPSALFLSIISCISSFIGGIGNQKTMIYAPLAGLTFMVFSSFFLFYMELNVYYFIYAQNISYLIYIMFYLAFFIKKWREV